jgi:hypothetical protein
VYPGRSTITIHGLPSSRLGRTPSVACRDFITLPRFKKGMITPRRRDAKMSERKIGRVVVQMEVKHRGQAGFVPLLRSLGKKKIRWWCCGFYQHVTPTEFRRGAGQGVNGGEVDD